MKIPSFTGDLAVVWLKRDIRLYDHEALDKALQHEKVLIFYAFEPFLLNDPHYSPRHFRFIAESINEINHELLPHNTQVLITFSSVLKVLETLSNKFENFTLYSHLEVGINSTFQRDIAVSKWCRHEGVRWHECKQNGVIRGLQTRINWKSQWEHFMQAPLIEFNPRPEVFLETDTVKTLQHEIPQEENNSQSRSLEDFLIKDESVEQQGGTSHGMTYLNSFLSERHKGYSKGISKPQESRVSCSRLSPYIAWGNLSVRHIWQASKEQRPHTKSKRSLDQFTSRLRWQSHFMQKFESECAMEFRSVNRAYQDLSKSKDTIKLEAWKNGQTGVPIVDASIRCLAATGYLNFRMRALIVSFATHLLWLPWQSIATQLAQWFLDFEPGIHYPQLQMQAGETGINQIRIYNPIKNSYTHDPDGRFILRWVPELQSIPISFVHEPYLLTPLESALYGFELGVHYPRPIINLKEARKFASDALYAFQKEESTRQESKRVLLKHTLADRKAWSSTRKG